ncbi:MAG: DUF488 family protein [Ignavibacteriales bacterium]|nr:MAG: DUF488 family protein [Ignavibacteriales bacterium]
MKISIQRIYDKNSTPDGKRILVDRLWPRGIKKENAKIDLWAKELAPSNELRKWYKHDAENWLEFKEKYFSELRSKRESINELIKFIGSANTVFLYSSKELVHNNAAAIKEYLESKK